MKFLNNVSILTDEHSTYALNIKGDVNISSGSKYKINGTDLDYSHVGATPSSHVGATGDAHGIVTTSVNGFMSSTDKTKLDGVATGANNYSLPTASLTTLGGVKIGSGVSISSGVISVSTNYQAPLSNVASGATVTLLNGNTVRGLKSGTNVTISEASDVITISSSWRSISSAPSSGASSTSISSDWAHTHTINSSAHHTRYADSEAVSAVATADSYVKNTSDTMSGTLGVAGLITASSGITVGTDKKIDILAGNTDLDFLRLRYNDSDAYGYYWRYTGVQSGNNNGLELWSTGETSGADKLIYRATLDGVANFPNGLKLNGTTVSVVGHTHTFASLTAKPTTLSGYGITDAMNTSHDANAINSTNITNWNTAYTNTHTSGSDNQTITSGNGMNFTSGSGDVTITLGTPGNLTTTSTSALQANSHTHKIEGFIPSVSGAVTGYMPKFDTNGNLVDSGIRAADVATGKGYAYVKRFKTTLSTSSNTVTFNIPNFEKITDSLLIYENLVYYLEEGVDYTVTNNTTITLNTNKASGTRYDFIAFMNVPEAGETYSGIYVTDGSITDAKLATGIKIGDLSNLDIGSNHTNIVSAINSVYESAAKVDNPLTLQFDTGFDEGTDKYVFDGSGNIGINIKGGTNISLAKSAGTITINSSGTYDRATSVLSGATVFSDIIISKGMVTGTATRNLSPANIGAAPSSHNHSASNITDGTLGVVRGGTGASTFISGKVLFGNGTNAINTNDNLHWNNTNSRLGVGTTAPDESIHTPGAVKADSGVVVGNFKMEYNAGTESLQFNFVG